MKERFEVTARWVAIRHNDPEKLDRNVLVPTMYIGTNRRPAACDRLNNRMRTWAWNAKQQAKFAARKEELDREYAAEYR